MPDNMGELVIQYLKGLSPAENAKLIEAMTAD
jgi:hypothetical protein